MTDLAKAPFVARREYFGCLVFDRSNSDYIPFDQEATDIFEASLEMSPDEVYRDVAESVSRQSFDTFIQLCSSIGLFENGTFQGAFLDRKPTEGFYNLSAPTMVYLQLTRYCNLACKHCWSDSGEARPRELTILEVRTLLDQMAELGCFKLRLGGGEPLGRGDWYDIVKYANSKGIRVSLSTNATMATRAVAGKIGELDIDEIKVSLEAASEKSYDYIRGERSYRKAIRGIKNLKELANAPVYFYTVLQRDNLTEIPALVKQAEKHQMDKIVFDTIVPVGRAKQHQRLLLTPEEANNALDLARRIGQTSRVKVEINGRVPPPYQKKRVFEGFGSEGGRLYCHISSEGVVSSSGFVSDLLPAGNIRDRGLLELWEEGPGFKSLRSSPGNQVCNNCDYFRSCRGGSRARTYATLGSLTEPDPICLVAKEAVR